mmetsp:Transcript_5619/g.15143  ORF Transcript_5619/g.15143 Transcript_5619/m.15143 type:complete len:204 (-) Transcript_5619:198-809(-)
MVAWSRSRGSPKASDIAFTTLAAIRLKSRNSLSLNFGFSLYQGCVRSSRWRSQICRSWSMSAVETTLLISLRPCSRQFVSPCGCGQCSRAPARARTRTSVGRSPSSLDEPGWRSLELRSLVRGELPALVVGVSPGGGDLLPSPLQQSLHATFLRSATHFSHSHASSSSSLGTHAIMSRPRLRACRLCKSAVVSQTPLPVPGRK